MAFDVGEFFGGLGDSIWDEAGRLGNTIIPGLTAAGAGYAANALENIAQGEKKKAQAGLEAVLNAPPGDPNSFSSYLSSTFASIGGNAGLKTYAPYILLGVVAVGITAVVVFGGRK